MMECSTSAASSRRLLLLVWVWGALVFLLGGVTTRAPLCCCSGTGLDDKIPNVVTLGAEPRPELRHAHFVLAEAADDATADATADEHAPGPPAYPGQYEPTPRPDDPWPRPDDPPRPRPDDPWQPQPGDPLPGPRPGDPLPEPRPGDPLPRPRPGDPDPLPGPRPGDPLPRPRPDDPWTPRPEDPPRPRPEDPPRPRPDDPWRPRPEDPPRPRPDDILPRPRPDDPWTPRPDDPPRPRPDDPPRPGPDDPPRPRPDDPWRPGPEDPPRPRPDDPPLPRPDDPWRPPRPEDPPRPRPDDPPLPRPDDPWRPPRPEDPPRPRPDDPPRPRPDDPWAPPRPEDPPLPRPDDPWRPRPDDPPRPGPGDPLPGPRPDDPWRPRPDDPPQPRPEDPPRPRPGDPGWPGGPEDPPVPPRPEDPWRPQPAEELPGPGSDEPSDEPAGGTQQLEKRRLSETANGGGVPNSQVSDSPIAVDEHKAKALTNRWNDFPKTFVFGTASAAYQYEGAASEGGRGPSIWDTWSHKEGNMDRGATGDVAVDQYHRYKEDVQLMKQLSVDAYRFSISWSRIYPSGRGDVNEEGVKYYNNLIDELLANNIQPFVTLYHWDLPQALDDAYEGWLSSQIVDDFAAYAETCYKLFGDRVKHWITFNEPHVFVPYGYDNGVMPPGRCTPVFNSRCSRGNSSTETYRAAHNVLLSHAAAYQVYKDKYQKDQQGYVGITLDTTWYRPLTDSSVDRHAAERALLFQIGWFLDPVVFGSYPEVIRAVAGNRLPEFTEEQAKSLKGSYDFVGLNHYTSQYAADAPPRPDGDPESYFSDQSVRVTAEKEGKLIGTRGATEWLFVVPDGIERVLLWVKDRYNNPPVYITENGYADSASLPREQSLRDDIRTSYFKDYLAYVSRAIHHGADLRGYFAWSLLDNLEWGNGYSVRFGVYYVDYEDGLRRYAKDSALWFREYLGGRAVSRTLE